MTVTTISTSGGHIAEVTGTGYSAMGDIQLRAYKGRDLDVARMAVNNMLEVYLYIQHYVRRKLRFSIGQVFSKLFKKEW